MSQFLIDQSSREALTKERAEQLLEGLDEGVASVKLSGKSFGDGSAEVAAAALQRAIPSLLHLDISDVIASRPEEEAKRVLATIADGLASCKHLEFIDLSDNALGAKGIRAVGGLLAGQKKLKELLLCNNGLAADAGKLITAALLETSPTALIKLHFHNNLLETAGSVALAPIVESSPLLEDFRFSSLRLGREGAVRICEALMPRICSTLKHLNISDNSFGEEGAEALARALADAPVLETLIVNDALLGDTGTRMVCEALAMGAPKLKVLNISGNEMSVGGARGLAKLLSVGTLKQVIAEDNEFGSGGAVRLAKGIKKGSRLEILNVSSSEVGGRGALALANAVSKVSGFREILMDGNMIPAEAVSEMESVLEEKLGPLDDNDDEGDEDDDEDEDDDDQEGEDTDENAEAEQGKPVELKIANGLKHVATSEPTNDVEVDDLATSLGKVKV